MFCGKCGKEIPDGASLCPACGGAGRPLPAKPDGQPALTGEQLPAKSRTAPILLAFFLGCLAGGLIAVGAARLLSLHDEARERVRGRARSALCMRQMKQIGLALAMYASDYENQFPPWENVDGLEILRSTGYLSDYSMYVCPSSGTKPGAGGEPLTAANCDYLYLAGLDMGNWYANCPVLIERPKVHSGNLANVLYGYGHVRAVQLPDTVQTVADLLDYLADQAANPDVKAFLRQKRERYYWH